MKNATSGGYYENKRHELRARHSARKAFNGIGRLCSTISKSGMALGGLIDVGIIKLRKRSRPLAEALYIT